MSNKTPLKLFYSYSHKDEDLQKELDSHLKILEREGYIDSWHDRKILGGEEWKDEIDQNLHNSQIVLLLISADFISSGYCYDKEMKAALQMHEEKKAVVIPVILRDCVWNIAPFSKLQGLPTDGKPITGKDWHNKDTAYRVVTESLKKVIDEFRSNVKAEPKQVEPTDKYDYQRIQLKQIPVSKPYFSGRETELEKLTQLFVTKHFILIEGAGGIGKTQFVSKFIDDSDVAKRTVWYECHPTSQPDDIILGAGFDELLIGGNKSEREKYIAFKDKIEELELVIFIDNYQEVQLNKAFQSFLSFINDYLGKGCVIVICRDNISSATLQPARIHLDGLGDSSFKHARKLLEHSFPEKSTVSDEILMSICDTLMGYPLAIDLAMYLLSQDVPHEKILDVAVSEAKAGDGQEKISERLLNEIFIRPDSTEKEKIFLKEFSIYRGKVNIDAIEAITSIDGIDSIIRVLRNKNILNGNDGYYELHPLIREFCYEKLEERMSKHSLAASYFITLRTNNLDSVLEEKVYYHLSCANRWNDVVAIIQSYGPTFIDKGHLDRLKQMIAETRKNGFNEPFFDLQQGDIEQIKGNWLQAVSFFEKAKDNVDDVIAIEGTIKYGEMLFRLGKLMEAKHVYEDVIRRCGESNDTWLARVQNNLGLIYWQSGNVKEGLRRLNSALKMRRYLGDKRDISVTLHNIAHVYLEKGNNDTALVLEEEALSLCTETKDIIYRPAYLQVIGKIYLRKNKLSIAKEYLDKAYKIAKSLGDKAGIGTIYSHYSNLKELQGEMDEALVYMQQSLQISKDLGDKLNMATSYHNIGLMMHEDFNDAAAGIYNLLFAVALYLDIRSVNKESLYALHKIKSKIGQDAFKENVMSSLKKMPSELSAFLDIDVILGQPKVAKQKVGRNDPCPCGNGKKYKVCHGKDL